MQGLFLRSIGVWCYPLHPTLGKDDSAKPELFVKSVGVERSKQPAAQGLKIGLFDDHFHQPFAKPTSAMFTENINVADISERRFVRNDPRESNLLFSTIQSEAKRILDRR